MKSTNFGVRFPRETIDRLDQLKGKYNSRNQLLRKIVDEYLDKVESDNGEQQEQKKGVRASHPSTNTSKLLSSAPTIGGSKSK